MFIVFERIFFAGTGWDVGCCWRGSPIYVNLIAAPGVFARHASLGLLNPFWPYLKAVDIVVS